VWPVDVRRNTTVRLASGSLRYPDLLKVASIQTQLEDAQRAAAQVEAAQAAHVEAAQAEIEQLKDACGVGAKQLAEARSEISELRRSRSWRVAAPIRGVAAAVRARRHGSGPA
jgi:multidrug resistance efflux pump